MTIDDEILKELKWQSKLIEAEFALLSELKFELLNSHKLTDATYTVPVPEKKGFVEKTREKIKKIISL